MFVNTLLRETMDSAQIPRGIDRTPAGMRPSERPPLIAVLGLGDVGLRSAAALQRTGMEVLGIDLSNEARLAEADAVLVCVPTADEEPHQPDLSELNAACAAVCRHARRGQTIVLTSVGYVGATRDLLVRPLAEAGFELGTDVCVACSPPEPAPRVLGADSELCAEKAKAVIGALAPSIQIVASTELAELTMLQ